LGRRGDQVVEKGGAKEEKAVVVTPFGGIDLRTIICPDTIKHPEIRINKSYHQSPDQIPGSSLPQRTCGQGE